nr:reverse transcriptase domain-containing protein [Tanacetum cinerariifolium]
MEQTKTIKRRWKSPCYAGGVVPVARECTYQDFVKCQSINFKGTKGVIVLTRWLKNTKTIFYISNCPQKCQVKYALCTLQDSTYEVDDKVCCPRNEIQKMETRLWNLAVKGNDMTSYTQRFQELILLCTKMVLEEEDQVEKFIGGLLNQKLKGYAAKDAENKRRFDSSPRDNRVQQPPLKRQNVARAYTVRNNKNKGYAGILPLCDKRKLPHHGPCLVRCENCKKNVNGDGEARRNLDIVMVGETSTNSNPKGRNRRRSKQRVEPFSLEKTPIVTMADQRAMAELLHAPAKGYAEAIMVPPISAEHFKLKHSLINLVTSKFGFEKEVSHAHIQYFNKITSTLKYKDVPESLIKIMLFLFSIDVPARIWLDKEPSRSILTWDDLISMFINHFFPPSKITNLWNEISSFQQRFDESFYEAWDHFKDLLRECPHYGSIELHQLDTIYNGLNPSDQDSLNSATGGNLLERSAQDVLKIIESKSKVRNSRNKLIVPQVKESNVNSSDIASVVTSAMTAMFKQHQVNPAPASVKVVEESCVICGGAYSYRQCPATNGNTFSGYQDNIQGYVSAAAVNYNQGNTGTGPLPNNTIANPKGELKVITTRSGVSYDGPPIPRPFSSLPKVVERVPKVTKDTVQPRDPDKFLTPCDFPELVECLALADQGTSIKFMSLLIWDKLSLLELTPIQMILELADRSTTRLAGIVEDVFVKVGKFHFLTDFVVIDYVVDPPVPLILRRPFLRTEGALIDVNGEQLTLRVDDKAISFKVSQTSKYSYNDASSINRIDVIDVAFKSSIDDPPELKLKDLPFHLERANPKIHEVIKKEVVKLLDAGLIYPISDSPWVSPIHCVPKKGGMIVTENEENDLIPARLVMGWRVCIDYRKLNDATRKDYFLLPFMDQMLERLAENEFYCFLDGFFGYFQIPIDPQDQENTTFTCPYEYIAYRRMPFGLCNALDQTFQAIHYASKTMTDILAHYTTTKKELLAVVYAFKKFRPYLVLSKTIVYTDHSARKYLLAKQDPKPRLLRKILLLQEFDVIIQDKKGAENLAADHLSRLENPHQSDLKKKEITKTFPLETLGMVTFHGDAKVMLKYGVTHRLSTVYHPQTSGQVEVSNRGLKRILERTVGENHASWSDKLGDALWALCTAYKTPIGCTPYKLVYGKACHLPIELVHKAYWILKHCNFYLKTAGDHQKVKMNELNELCDQAYENSLIYKEKTKKIHDSKIKNRIFNVGDRVLLFNSRLNIFF